MEIGNRRDFVLGAGLRVAVARQRARGGEANPVTISTSDDGLGLDPSFLVNFVLLSRVDLLCERAWDEQQGWVPLPSGQQLNREQLGGRLGWSKKDLSALLASAHRPHETAERRGAALLRHGDRLRKGWMASKYSARFAMRRDVASLEADLRMFALRYRGASPDAVADLGGLSSFWQEMVGSAETAVQMNVQEARWFRDLAECGPQTSAEALIGGQTLFSLLGCAQNREDALLLLNAHREQTTRIVRGLLTVVTKPPSRGVLPSLNQLALLGNLPVQWGPSGERSVLDLVVEHVRDSPVGFRATRVLARMATLSSDADLLPAWWSDGARAERAAVWDALQTVMRLNGRDPYPARSLSIEVLRTLRLGRDSRYAEPTLGALEDRARNVTRPVRERSYAAYCMYLALRQVDHTRIYRLLDDLLVPVGDQPIDDGLIYASRVIRLLLSGEQGTLSLTRLLLDTTQEPDDETMLAGYMDDMAVLVVDGYLYPHRAQQTQRAKIEDLFNQVPPTVREPMRSLTRYALLSIDGSGRRRSAEALREAGLAPEASYVIQEVMLDSDSPRWLREQAAFLLGYLGSTTAVGPLLEIIGRKIGRGFAEPPSVRHAAVWALGDIGCADAESIGTLCSILAAHNEAEVVVRAAAYSLAALHPEPEGSVEKVRAALEKAAAHKDALVADLARWGLVDRARRASRQEHRFSDDLWAIDIDIRGTLAAALEPSAWAPALLR
jgi:PBS lyase HEAT-like repeat